MFQNVIGSLLKAVPSSVVAPVAGIAAAAAKVVAPITSPITQTIQSTFDALSGGQSSGSLPSGLRAEVNILKSVVSGQQMDATAKSHIQGALDEVKAGKPLEQCLSPLSSQEKTLLADTIGNAGFEPPECLTSYLTNKSQGDSSRMDCALKNVEVAEQKGYSATEASAMFGLFPLAGVLLGG